MHDADIPLQAIDPTINTLPYLFILLADIAYVGVTPKDAIKSKTFRPSGALWQRMTEFMDCFDRVQVRYAGNEFRRLVEFTAKKARDAGQV
jgi:COP9 signalosome complex subunit 3